MSFVILQFFTKSISLSKFILNYITDLNLTMPIHLQILVGCKTDLSHFGTCWERFLSQQGVSPWKQNLLFVSSRLWNPKLRVCKSETNISWNHQSILDSENNSFYSILGGRFWPWLGNVTVPCARWWYQISDIRWWYQQNSLKYFELVSESAVVPDLTCAQQMPLKAIKLNDIGLVSKRLNKN